MLVYDSAILVKNKRSTSQAKYSSSTATARLSNHSSNDFIRHHYPTMGEESSELLWPTRAREMVRIDTKRVSRETMKIR